MKKVVSVWKDWENTGRWSECYDLLKLIDDHSVLPDATGTYVVFAFDGEEPIPFEHRDIIDPDGILYIRENVNLRDDILHFARSLQDPKMLKCHEAAVTYYELDMDDVAPLEGLKVRFTTGV